MSLRTRLFASLASTLVFAACGASEVAVTETADMGESADALKSNLRVVYVGDSISYETAPVVKANLAKAGVGFAQATKGGLAICDYFPETTSTFRLWGDNKPPNLFDIVAFVRPQVVVMQFWGNSWGMTPCMKGPDGVILAPGTPEYFERYKSDANHAMEIIRDAAAKVGAPMPKVLWVMQGPDFANAKRTPMLNFNYAYLGTKWPTLGAIDAGKEVSLAANYYNPGDRYGWTQWLPCTQEERSTGHCNPAYGGIAQIHSDADHLHFCLGKVGPAGCDVWSPGVHRYANAISAGVLKALKN